MSSFNSGSEESIILAPDAITILSAKLSSFFEDTAGYAPIVSPSSDHPSFDDVADNKNAEYMEERRHGVTQGDFLQMLAEDYKYYSGANATATKRQYIDERKFNAVRTVLEGAAQGKDVPSIVKAATMIDASCSEAAFLRGLYMENRLYDSCQTIVKAEIMATQQVVPELFRAAKNRQTMWTTVSLRNMIRCAFAVASILNKMGRHAEALQKLERFEMIERKFIDDPFYPQFRALMPELLLRAKRIDDCQKFLLSDLSEQTFRRYPFVRPYFLWAQAFIDFTKQQDKNAMASNSFNYVLHMAQPSTAATPSFYVGRALSFAYQSCPHIIDYLWGGSEETLKLNGRVLPYTPPSMHPSGAHRELAVDYARTVKELFKSNGFLDWARRNINTWRAATFIDFPIGDRITGAPSFENFRVLLANGFLQGPLGGFGSLLHRAVAAANPDILTVTALLVNKHTPNPKIPNLQSPLAIAIRRDLPIEFTHLLILNGADPWEGWADYSPEPNQLSAMAVACLFGRWRHLKLMFTQVPSVRTPKISRLNQLKRLLDDVLWEFASAGNEDSPTFTSVASNLRRCQAMLEMCRPTADSGPSPRCPAQKEQKEPAAANTTKKDQGAAKATPAPSASAEEESFTASKKKEKLCDVCAKPGAKDKCGACRGRRYCSPECQRTDWKTHKLVCKK